MQKILKAEEAAMAMLAIYLLTFYNLGIPVWAWVFLFFLPDIGMLGYAINNRVGAVTYNLFHHKGIAVLIALLGYWLRLDAVTASGILLFGHSSLDRMLGYGLKYFSDFKDTHLGRLPGGRHQNK